MNKIGLIIAREFLTRVKKKSFIIMTLLGPVLFAAIIFLPAWLATRGGDEKSIAVLDESGLFDEAFIDTDQTTFSYQPDGDLDQMKQQVLDEVYHGLLYIPEMEVDNPAGVAFYSSSNPSISMVESLSKKIEGKIENIKLVNSGIDQEVLDGLKANISISTISLSGSGGEKESSSVAATIIGYGASFMIYIFIFVYGAQCMRGVIEEKSSRIIEVIISSVKPFQLMMGKVIGIVGVGLSQLLLWIVLTLALSTVAGTVFLEDAMKVRQDPMSQVQGMPDSGEDQPQENMYAKVASSVNAINIPLVVCAFLFFFVSGYLLYGALFAAVGSAVDSDADAQQFMFPVTIPLVISIVMLGVVLNDPNGTLAFWLSVIPFTAPVVMMMRVPFGVPAWELALSMVLMVGGFMFTIWVASRIYRVGILMHGTKVNYKILGRWLMMKN